MLFTSKQTNRNQNVDVDNIKLKSFVAKDIQHPLTEMPEDLI